MRYDKVIFFQKVKVGEYNKNSGDYDEPIIEETKRYANITNSGVETLKLIYGELKQGTLTIRILGEHKGLFDFIRIGNKRYKVDFSRALRRNQAFIVSEVQ